VNALALRKVRPQKSLDDINIQIGQKTPSNLQESSCRLFYIFSSQYTRNPDIRIGCAEDVTILKYFPVPIAARGPTTNLQHRRTSAFTKLSNYIAFAGYIATYITAKVHTGSTEIRVSPYPSRVGCPMTGRHQVRDQKIIKALLHEST